MDYGGRNPRAVIGEKRERDDERDCRDEAPKLTKSEIDEARKQRLAMVKRLTADTDVATEAPAEPAQPIVPEDEDEEAEMKRIMGISDFGSTKGKAVEGNHSGPAAGTVSKHKARKYRQYMNRQGGFNKPLDKID